jgi:hypothetical protein
MSVWLFGPLDLDLRYRATVEKAGLEPSWLPKQHPDAYLDAELKLQERLALAEAAKRVQQRTGTTIGAALGFHPSPQAQHHHRRLSPRAPGSSASPRSPFRSEESGGVTFDEADMDEVDDEDDDDDDDDDFPVPPLVQFRSLRGAFAGATPDRELRM